MKTAKIAESAARALAQVLFIGFFVFPIIWIFMMSLKNFRDIISYPPKFLFSPTLQNYRETILGARRDAARWRAAGICQVPAELSDHIRWSRVPGPHYWAYPPPTLWHAADFPGADTLHSHSFHFGLRPS